MSISFCRKEKQESFGTIPSPLLGFSSLLPGGSPGRTCLGCPTGAGKDTELGSGGVRHVWKRGW